MKVLGTRRPLMGVAALGGGVAVAGSYLAGVHGLAVLAVVSLPWWLAIAARHGRVIASAVVLASAPLLVTAAAVLAPRVGVTLDAAWATVVGAGASSGVVALWGVGRAWSAPLRAGRSAAWGVLAGPGVWGVTAVVAWISGVSWRGWTIWGDSINHVILSRKMRFAGGEAVSGEDSAVPMIQDLLVFATNTGGRELTARDQFTLEIAALAILWHLSVIAMTLFAGHAASAVVRAASASPRTTALAGVVGSVLPLSWFVTGYSITHGFINGLVVAALLLAALAVTLTTSAPVLTRIGVLAVLASSVLAVWTPLALLPAALALPLIVSEARVAGWRRLVLSPPALAGIASGAAFFAMVTLPSYLYHDDALAAAGQVQTFPKLMLPGALAVAWCLCRVVEGRWWGSVGTSMVAMGGMSLVVLVGLVVAAGNGLEKWSYYPQKFAWLTTAALLVPIAALALVAVAKLAPGRRRDGAALVAWLALGVPLGVAPVVDLLAPETVARPHGLALLAQSRYAGDGEQVVEQVAAVVTDDAIIGYGSPTGPQGYANRWLFLLPFAAFPDDASKDALDAYWFVAHVGDFSHAQAWCGLASASGQSLQVITDDPVLIAEIGEECPAVAAIVEPGALRRSP